MSKISHKVLCIGSMGKDVFFPLDTKNEELSHCDEKHGKQFCFDYGSKVHIDDRYSAPGGCACNVSIGLARLNVGASALGNVGDDADGAWIVDSLVQEDVKTDELRIFPKTKTDLSVILVDQNEGERTIFVNRDVGEQLVIGERDIKKYNWCFIGSLYGDAISDNMRVIHNAVKNDEIKIAYNPGCHNIDQDEHVVLDLIHHAHIVFVNKNEAQKIIAKFTDIDCSDQERNDEMFLLQTLFTHMKEESGHVIVTDGRRGAWVYDGSVVYHTDTIDKKVHDATGAGDAFASGFFAAILYGKTTGEAVAWGSANGNAVIDHYGAQSGLLMYDTINEQMRQFEVQLIK